MDQQIAIENIFLQQCAYGKLEISCSNFKKFSDGLVCFVSLIIMIISFIIILMRIIKFKQIFTRKQILIALIAICSLGKFTLIFSVLVFVLFHFDRKGQYFYFLYYYFCYIYLTFLLYYYTRKTVKGLNQESILNMKKVNIAALITFIFFTAMLIWNFIKYFLLSEDYHLCYEFYFYVFRGIAFLMNFTFLFVGKSYIFELINQFQENLYKNNQFGIQLKYLKIQQIAKQDFSTENYKGKHKNYGSQNNQNYLNRRLILINLLSQFILFLENIYFLINNHLHEDYECRIFPHYGGNEDNSNWSDMINVLLQFFIIILSNQIPYILTLNIFWTSNNKSIFESVILVLQEIIFNFSKNNRLNHVFFGMNHFITDQLQKELKLNQKIMQPLFKKAPAK